MKLGQVFVRAMVPDEKGDWRSESVDVLDLDEQSFRVFVLDVLNRQGVVHALRDKIVDGDHLTLRRRKRLRAR